MHASSSQVWSSNITKLFVQHLSRSLIMKHILGQLLSLYIKIKIRKLKTITEQSNIVQKKKRSQIKNELLFTVIIINGEDKRT